MSDKDVTSVYLRMLAEKAEDSLERDHDARENAARLATAFGAQGKPLPQMIVRSVRNVSR